MTQDTISRSRILPCPRCYDKRQATEQLQIILLQQVSTPRVQWSGVEMVAAACQHHIKPTAKISSPISATFRPYLSSVEGSGFLHVYLSPVVIFPRYASKADRSSKETPLSYMLNRFDPGLASSNLCLCFKNQISADKEALLKINFTQSVSEAGAKNRRKKDVVCSIKDSSSTTRSCVGPVLQEHPNCSNHLSRFLFVQTKLVVINSLLQSTTSPSVLLSLYSGMGFSDIHFPRYVH